MSIRLRLALWYGALTGLVVLFVATLTYAAHIRGHYDDLDAVLVGGGLHVAEEYAAAGTPAERAAVLAAPPAAGLVLRLQGRAGEAVGGSSGAEALPRIDAAALLERPSTAPFDPVAGLAPAVAAPDPVPGALGVAAGPDGRRWRAYAVYLPGADAYLVAAAPLDRIDASVASFRRLVVALVAVAAVATLGAGWRMAGRVLRPVALLTQAAGDIARSRGFGRRVSVGGRRDELGRLAATFNGMLASLEEAYEAQRRFVADASHELRAPLTAIQANLELLERQPGMPAGERAEAVAEAGREARRLTRLVADLLALARADAGVALRRERVELDRVALEALAQAQHLARGQTMRLAGLEPVLVEGDGDRLKQLLLILLDNAVKYTPPGGAVTLGLRRNGGGAEVVVRDTGVGIAPEDLPHVFERFYRADRARTRETGGAGLGLSIARWIAEQHRGAIGVDSEPDRGTTVTVRLPAAA